MRCKHSYPSRSGNVVVFTAVMMVVLFAMLAFAVDVGYLNVVRSQLQGAADATALAATWELVDGQTVLGQADPLIRDARVRYMADRYAEYNPVAGSASDLCSGDVEIGYLANPSDPAGQMIFADPIRFNAVHIRIRRAPTVNGEVPLFFARVLGINTMAAEAEATAAFIGNIAGFEIKDSSRRLEILPFALDVQTWNDLKAGGGSDSFKWDPESRTVKPEADGIREVNLFPQGTGSPGNRGTVDIGGSNNSTSDICRQIREGISKADLEALGKPLEFDAEGHLALNGDTGISAGVKDDLISIKGEPRIIPVFDLVTGPGNNAQYRIVKFVGVRIMNVDFKGGSKTNKQVIIQPARVFPRGAIAGTTPGQSEFIHSQVWLVR